MISRNFAWCFTLINDERGAASMRKELKAARETKRRIGWYKKMIMRKVKMINDEDSLNEVFVVCRELLKIN